MTAYGCLFNTRITATHGSKHFTFWAVSPQNTSPTKGEPEFARLRALIAQARPSIPVLTRIMDKILEADKPKQSSLLPESRTRQKKERRKRLSYDSLRGPVLHCDFSEGARQL
ncbi:hypothetical protein KDK_28250 [Dictyobacter kobayashii]|uniref:Uncharacterized protein n=1 Tax=Dictyobacter kobayashii TaxID=2014872 RepID=A0A402AIZ1_9CHLR|nr:hypothetical protein KDK_28250 [Dictyobacter kobayashii]